MNLGPQIDYWIESAKEDLDAAASLFNSRKYRHALFFAHLAVEKALKALVVYETKAVPPKIHDLLRLTDLAGLTASKSQRIFLAELQRYCIEGRYVDFQSSMPSEDFAGNMLQESRSVLTWLANQLK
jgi:HEPN domain-containing protein